MQQQLEARLQALKSEFETGQKMLAEQEAQQAQLRNTLLRISGALQALHELKEAFASVDAATMQEQLETRIEQLESEFQTGQKMQAEQEARQAQLHDTLLRIDGAILGLNELKVEIDRAQAADADSEPEILDPSDQP